MRPRKTYVATALALKSSDVASPFTATGLLNSGVIVYPGALAVRCHVPFGKVTDQNATAAPPPCGTALITVKLSKPSLTVAITPAGRPWIVPESTPPTGVISAP